MICYRCGYLNCLVNFNNIRFRSKSKLPKISFYPADGARYLYGHRAPAPPTEHPPIPAFPCPDPGHNTRDRLGAELTEGVASWAACAALCRGRAGCRYWTWHHEGAGQFAFRCVTMEDVISRVPDQNAVSGTKKCVG